MKKIVIVVFLFIAWANVQSQSVHTVRLNQQSSVLFYPFCSEFFYCEALKNFNFAEDTVVHSVIKHLNANNLILELVSQVPIEEQGAFDQFLPKLFFNGSLKKPTIRWDIRHLEERAIRYAIKQKKARMKTHYIILEKGSTPPNVATPEKDDPPHQNGYLHAPLLETKEAELTSCLCCKPEWLKSAKPQENWFRQHRPTLVACCVGTVGVASGWLAHSWWQSSCTR